MQYDKNLYALFEAQAAATPDAIAIIEGVSSNTSYSELEFQASKIAAHLRDCGLQAEQLVGVKLPRTASTVAALLGIWKSGGAYVHIDPDDPIARQLNIVSASGCKLILTNSESISEWRAASADVSSSLLSVELLDIEKIETSPEKLAPQVTAPGGERLAYIMFTSGSQGEPKGVLTEHQGVLNLLATMRNLIDFTSDDCFLAVATFGFDISVVELFLPLMTGGRILLRDRHSLMQPQQLVEDIRQHDVSVMQTGPSVWAVLLAGVDNFPQLRVVISTAEPLSHELGRQLTTIGEQAWNLYGPTETTIWSTAYRMTAEEKQDPNFPCSSVSIGLPLANTYLCIVDEHGERVLAGTKGELCINGMGVARGYHNNAELTREKFVNLAHDERRYYKTGDITSWSAEGTLLYHGRNDEQMKIRGVRIDPGEIEASLLSYSGVAHAAITWYQGATDSRSIIAAIVLEKDAAVTPRQLYDWLTLRLPATMVPSRYTFCTALPLSSSGKADRSAIRELAEQVTDTLPRHERNLSRTERKVMNIWQRVLQVEGMALNDHFFSMGGDSLAAVRVITHIEEAFAINLSVRVIFEQPTIEQFAAHIDALGAKSGRQSLSAKIRSLARRTTAKQRQLLPMLGGNTTAGNSGFLPEYSESMDIETILAKQQALITAWPGKRNTPDSFVFSLNESGHKQALFWCMQGAREFEAFARLLGPQQPIYAMRSYFLLLPYGYESQAKLMAARYAAEMNDLQAEGPFLLGGNCAGGVMMRLVADQLQEMGREVTLLILMEQAIFRPFNEKVALIFGKESHLNPYLTPQSDPDCIFRKTYPAGYTVDLVSGAHGEFFSPHNVDALMQIIAKRISH